MNAYRFSRRFLGPCSQVWSCQGWQLVYRHLSLDGNLVKLEVPWFQEGAGLHPAGVQAEEGTEEGSEDEATGGRAGGGEEQMALV